MFKKSVFLAAASFAALAVPATGAAAETSARDPFSGLYAGIHAGMTRGTISLGARTVTRPEETVPGATANDPDIVLPAADATIPRDSGGSGLSLLGGGQIGFNYATQDILFGIEVDASLTTAGTNYEAQLIEEVTGDPAPPARLLTSNVSADIDYSGSARVRVGMRNEDLVYFVTAGLAAAHVSVDSTGNTLVQDGVDGTRTVTASDSANHMGWTGGAGILGWFGGHALGSIELRYSNYGSKTYDVAGTADTPTVPTRVGLSDIQLLVRMSYRF